MPFHPIHLAQTATARGWAKSVGTSAKDAQVINGLFEVSTNPLLGTKTVYVSKRGGSSVSSSNVGTGPIYLKLPGGDLSGGLFILTDGTFTTGTTSYGNVTSKPRTNTNYQVADGIVGVNQIIAFNTNTGGGWFLWEDATTTNFPTFSGDTHTNTTIDNIASTTGLYPGQLITGSGIQAGTRIATISSATAITTTIATTATAAGVTITKAAVAKIIDSDYPTTYLTGGVVQLDGYFFTADFNGNIYQSSINDPSSWEATSVLNSDYSGDELYLIFKIGSYIGAAGRGGTIQYFHNAGNPSGSILSPSQNLNVFGIQLITTPMPFGGEHYALVAAQSAYSGAYGLYKISGVNNFTRVSDDVWSSIISSLNLSLISPVTIGPKKMLCIHSTDDTVSVLYDPSVNGFSFIQLSTAYTSGSSDGTLFTRASSSDAIAWATGNTWTDESAAYTMTIQTEPQDMNQGMDATDVWVDLLADNESTGSTTLSTTDDDYANWVDRGSFDMTKTKKRLNALGLHNVRAYRLQHSANTGWRGQLLRVNYERAVS
jgi:hypothetical protein